MNVSSCSSQADQSAFQRKFNVPVTISLIKHRIIPVLDFEGQIAKFILRDFRPATIDFAAQLIRQILSEKPPMATRDQLARAIEALVQALHSDRGTEQSNQLLEDLRLGAGAASRAEMEAQEIKEQLTVFFVQWVRIYQQSTTLEKSFVEYVVQLQDQGILKGEDLSSRFFRSESIS